MTDHSSFEDRRKMAQELKEYLADTTIVYFKTHGFHWNVEGQNFYSLHLMFEKFYEELWNSMDEIAERIRALGEKVPPSFAELLKDATIKEAETPPTASIMILSLRDDYVQLAKRAHNIGSLADEQKDRVTTDMMTEKANFLEKATWMLQSTTTD
ncbi:MAG TPA: Dps family protein [Alphaproteobacteria bacterium]|nr:Dps family protein [Alphaproteobacteria bacterium]